MQHNPGTWKRAIRENVRGRGVEVDAAIYRLLQNRIIENRGSERRAEYFLIYENIGNAPGHRTDTHRDTLPDTHSAADSEEEMPF